MMTARGNLRYIRTPEMEAVSLPYSRERIRMDVFLPAPGKALQAFLKRMTPGLWRKWVERLDADREGMDGELILPRFRHEYESRLNDTLATLGMGIAFDPDRADFSEMTAAKPCWIELVRHKTFIEVNERGTEAAAVTGVIQGLGGISEPFRMIADRPFYYQIRESKTGLILFMGVVEEPM